MIKFTSFHVNFISNQVEHDNSVAGTYFTR